MPKFLQDIKVTVLDDLRELNFLATEDMKRWLDAEEPFWKNLETNSMNNSLKKYWDGQRNFFGYARDQLKQFEDALSSNQDQLALQYNQILIKHFEQQVSTGRIITSDHDIYPVIVDIAQVNLDVAGLLYVAAREDSQNTLGTFSSSGIPFKTLIDLILYHTKSRGTKDWLLPQRKEVTALKDESQAELASIRAKFEEQNQAIEEQRQHADQAHLGRESQWSTLKEQMNSEWEALNKVYDEQLALLAPTQYWTSRATSHRDTAIAFAIAFGFVLAASIGLFAWLAMPHMFAVAGNKDISPILTLVPIAIPAFAGVWVLKMLSRLLSENLQMMRDARERETMVKTFLALMRDDKSGKSIVNDNDRILILHSLFRPSSVTAVDDAPPVHWFDILTNKVGSKESNR